MDSVGVERAGLEKDLDETNTEIRRVKERLDDGSFVTKAKPALVEDKRAQLQQLGLSPPRRGELRPVKSMHFPIRVTGSRRCSAG